MCPRRHDHTDSPTRTSAAIGRIHRPSRKAWSCHSCSSLKNCRPLPRSASDIYIVQALAALIPGSHMWSDPATKSTAIGKNTQNHEKPSRFCAACRGGTAALTSTTINTANVHTPTITLPATAIINDTRPNQSRLVLVCAFPWPSPWWRTVSRAAVSYCSNARIASTAS